MSRLGVGSPIEGLGVLRRSLGQLPAGPRPLSGHSGPLRRSVSEERMSFERASQQSRQSQQQQQQMYTLEEQASLVLGRLLDSSSVATSNAS